LTRQSDSQQRVLGTEGSSLK